MLEVVGSSPASPTIFKYMITLEQEQWVNHLSDVKTIAIFPFDPTCEEKFLVIKNKIQNILGKEQAVEHRGASSLGISGQDEIDIYVPVEPGDFDLIIEKLKPIFGEPRSYYQLQRARFTTILEGKKIDVFVINKNHISWHETSAFENYLRTHSEALEEYRKLKESLAGKNVRDYYRSKTEFINGILAKVSNS